MKIIEKKEKIKGVYKGPLPTIKYLIPAYSYLYKDFSN